MEKPTSLNLRQTIEGMPLAFDYAAAGDLTATIQFGVSGSEPGVYHLRIAGGECTFHVGSAEAPTLTVATPSEVWLQISRGEVSGQEALMKGMYSASGDLSLLLRLDDLFETGEGFSYEASSGSRPPGPIPLSGMAWMSVAFVPWLIFWITFDIPGLSHWLSVGLPLFLSGLIVAYRMAFDKPTWMEVGGLGFFALASVATLIGDPGFAEGGSIISSLVMAGLWLSSLLLREMPLCGDYSKWDYVEALWHNSMFIYPNVAISLVWGWQFIVGALVGVAATSLPHLYGVLTAVRFLLQVPAYAFTLLYSRRATELKVADYEKTMSRLRLWAGVGLVVTVAMMAAVWLG